MQFHNIDNAGDRALNIASIPAVKNVWPVEKVYLPSDQRLWAGNQLRHTDHLIRKSGNGTGAPYPPHVMMQVDKLRAEGITGKGVKIAIIDSGVSLP